MKLFYAVVMATCVACATSAFAAPLDTGSNTTCKLANVFAGKTNIEIITHSDAKGPWQSGLIRDGQSIRAELTPERWGLGVDAPNGKPMGEIYQDRKIYPQGDEPGCSYKLERVKSGLHTIKLNGETIGTMAGSIPKNDAQVK